MIDCTNTYAAMHGYNYIHHNCTYIYAYVHIDYQTSLSYEVEKEVDSLVSKPALIS